MQRSLAIGLVFILVLSPLIALSPVWFVNSSDCPLLDGRGSLSSPQYFSSLDSREFTATWTSNWNDTSQPLTNNSLCVGDHVKVNVTIPNIPGEPENDVTSISLDFLAWEPIRTTRPLVQRYASYETEIIDPSEFDWVYVENVTNGDYIELEVNFTNSDCDIFVFWNDTAAYSWGGSLVQMATNQTPEQDSFFADRDGTLAIGCYNYDNQTGTWSLNLKNYAEGFHEYTNSNNVIADTYYLCNNATRYLEIQAQTVSNETLRFGLENVTFENLFAPKLSSLQIDSVGTVNTFSWLFNDLNVDEEHYFEALLSADDGLTYMLIAANLTETQYQWDSTGFLERDTYCIKIRVHDNDPFHDMSSINGDYWPGLQDEIESDTFTAGTVNSGFNPHWLTISLSSQTDIEFIQGEQSQILVWTVSVSGWGIANYVIDVDSTQNRTGILEIGTHTIEFDVSDLEPGTHNVRIRVTGNVEHQDDVTVTVLPSEIYMLNSIGAGITIGSCVVIGLVVILTLRTRFGVDPPNL